MGRRLRSLRENFYLGYTLETSRPIILLVWGGESSQRKMCCLPSGASGSGESLGGWLSGVLMWSPFNLWLMYKWHNSLTLAIVIVSKRKKNFRYISITTLCSMYWNSHYGKSSRHMPLSHSKRYRNPQKWFRVKGIDMFSSVQIYRLDRNVSAQWEAH